jgi:hypothetical protein
MQCTGPTTQGANQQWVCTAGGATNQRVQFTGPSANQINSVQATMAGAKGLTQIASTFLSTVAGLALTGSDATAAQQWINANIERGGTTTIGGVTMVIDWQGDNLVFTLAR